MGLTEQLDRITQLQDNFDRCAVCKRTMPPGSAVNKLYDDNLGEITVCVGCSLKAILWYVRDLNAHT